MNVQTRLESHTANDKLSEEKPAIAGAPTSPNPQHAQDLQRLLEGRFNDASGSPDTATPDTGPEQDSQRHSTDIRRNLRRLLKLLLGIMIVAFFGWIPLQALLQNSSVEAVVNTRVVTLRAPIDGQIYAARSGSSASGVVSQNTEVMRVINPRAERTRLDDLRRQRSRLENERPALVAKLEFAKTAQQDLARQVEQFTSRRIIQLEARIAEMQSTIEAAAARREEANAAVERATSLTRSGSVSPVELARVTREQTIARQTEIGARFRLDAANVELSAARERIFLGDSYNDRPSSAQREEEMRQRVDTLTADLGSTDAEMAWLASEVSYEQIRLSNLSESSIRLPVTGRVWETMTSPGEDVRAGQPLLRILDCSSAVVTANVTESVYNRLRVGAPARFKPADGGEEMAGTVSNLTGAAGAAANLAINPDSLSKEPYRVTVSIPQLNSNTRDCTVGQTGRVIFTGDSARAS